LALYNFYYIYQVNFKLYIMKKIILFLAVCLTFVLSNAQGSENFNNATSLPTGVDYGDGAFVGNGGITWNYFHCQTADVYPIDGSGILLRRSTEPSRISATFTGGIGNFSVDTRKGYTGNSQRRLELVINGEVVAQFQHTYPNGASSEVVPFVVNNINVEGTVNLELRMFGATGNQHLVLDNIVWTGYDGGEPEPTPVCDIVVNLEFPEYGDVTTWRLVDGSGATVLTGGPYSALDYVDFTVTSPTFIAVNPPYSLQIVRTSNTFYCDNDVIYNVTVGGVTDIQGSTMDPCSGGTLTIPLNSPLTACIPACPAPSGLSFTPLSISSASLSWGGEGGSFEVKWGATGFDVNTGGTLIDNITTTSVSVEGLTQNTNYQFYVRKDCTSTSDGYSGWAGPFTFSVGYCQPTAPTNNDATGITQVIFGNGESDDISNTSPSNNVFYSNFTSISKEVEVGETHNLSVRVNTDGNYTVVSRAWIDWNNDGVFNTALFEDGGEAYVLGSALNTANGLTSASPKAIVIPNVAPGSYRMRVKAIFGAANIPHPCTAQNYTDTEDYTIIVIDPCAGTALPVAAANQTLQVGQTLADLTVTGTGLVWYTDAGLTNTVPNTTAPAAGTTTYYVTQTVGSCTSAALAIVVTVEDATPPICDIVVNLDFPEYGDVITWRLIDGSGAVVLTGGPYPALTYNEFTITSSTYLAVNPPYSLQIIHGSNTFWCDNDVTYNVTVGGITDIQGTILDPCSGGNQTIPLNSDLTACIPACPVPTNLAVSNITSNSATLNWTGTGDSYTIEWGPAGFTPGTGTIISNVVGNSYVLNVPAAGAYEFYVTSHCGADDSLVGGPCVFLPGGYNSGDIPTQYNATPTINSTNYCTPEPTITIVVPAGYRIASLQVQYNMTAQNGAWKSEQRSFIYSPTLGTGEASLAVGIEDVAGTMSYNRPITFAHHQTGSIDFVLRAWRTWTTAGQEGCNTYNNYVNNNSWLIIPTFEPIPSCVEPTNVTLVDVTAYTAEFSWTAGSGVEEYTWYLFAQGDDPLTDDPIDFGFTETNSVTLYGLMPETTYDFYVTANCGEGNGESGYSMQSTFTTLIACPAPTDLAYVQLGMTSAELSFMSGGFVHELKWGEAGFDVEMDGTLVNLEEDTFTTVEGLISNAEYEFYVRQDCTATNDGYSVWVGPYSFYVGYCQPGQPGLDDATGITQVIFGNGESDDIDNISGSNNIFYSDYTSISKEVEVGETHNLSVRVNTSGNWTVQTTAWIDWNNDGVFNAMLFENGGEAYSLGSATNVINGLTSSSPKAIVIPNVPGGEYRLRIKTVYGAAVVPDPCMTQNYSETEDYTIIVIDPCAGTPTPSADSPQAMTVGQTVGDIEVEGENLTWYSDEDLTMVVEESMVLEEGSYTFYVTQTIGDCTSAAIEVVVEVTLSTGGFDVMSFKAYPNPVKDVFTISYSKNITEVTLVNMLGQVVVKQSVNSTDAQIDMSALPAGNYVVKVTIDGAVQTLKVVKQ